jgi:uncharacterized protein with GYD domain
MQTYIMFTQLISEEVNPTFSIHKKENKVAEKIREYCPDVDWINNYVIMGPWDYIDIFRAPTMEVALQVSTIVRSYGGTHTEIWPALEWNTFEKTIRDLAEVMET